MNTFSILASSTLVASGFMGQPIMASSNYEKMASNIDCLNVQLLNSSGNTYDYDFKLNNDIIRFSKANTRDNQMSPEVKEKTNRYKQLFNSFKVNKDLYPKDKIGIFIEMANTLCQMPFEGVHTSYNSFDESLDYILELAFGIKLSISRFVAEDDDTVVFSIHRNKRLLVSNELPVNELESKIVNLINELKEQYA